MSLNLKHNRGKFTDPMIFQDTSELSVENIALTMSQKIEEMGIPARIRTDMVKDGGLFGKAYPCVVIDHPSLPYFTDVYIVNGNAINFYFFGESKANTAANTAELRKNSILGSFRNLFAGSKEMELQQENVWHNQIFDVFNSLVH